MPAVRLPPGMDFLSCQYLVLDIHGQPIYSNAHINFLIDKSFISEYKAPFYMRRSKTAHELCVALDEIGESGYHLSCRKDQSWFVASLPEAKSIDCSFVDAIGLQLDFFKTGNAAAVVRGSIATTLQLGCVRCLEDFTLPLSVSFHYNLYPAEETDLPPEMEIHREDFDVYYYSGAVVDLTPLIVEQIVLHIPSYPLCQDSCRGICQRCGANLNHAPCHCTQDEAPVSQFAALKDFSPQQKT